MKDSPGCINGLHYTEYVEMIKELKRSNRIQEAISLLKKCVDAVESEAITNNWGVAPWYYEQLAVIYRKQKDMFSELEILIRFSNQKIGPGTSSLKLLERLEKLQNTMIE